MEELTFEQLKTALMCCTVLEQCDSCPLLPYYDASANFKPCRQMLLSAAFNCIKKMEKDFLD